MTGLSLTQRYVSVQPAMGSLRTKYRRDIEGLQGINAAALNILRPPSYLYEHIQAGVLWLALYLYGYIEIDIVWLPVYIINNIWPCCGWIGRRFFTGYIVFERDGSDGQLQD